MSVINWFEVPVADFERACKFYETVIGTQLFINDIARDDGQHAWRISLMTDRLAAAWSTIRNTATHRLPKGPWSISR